MSCMNIGNGGAAAMEDESVESFSVEIEQAIDDIYETMDIQSIVIARLQQETRDLKIFAVALTVIVCLMILLVYVFKQTAF